MTRGRLRIYLGAAPGVGTTYAMVGEGCRRAAGGADVVVGLVETHGRELTGAALGGLEVVPRREVRYRDTVLTELDTDAVLARAPRVALVDELAHTNAPGSAYPKRWQDVRRLLDAGIDVLTTLNVQHLESLAGVVEWITGVRPTETVPDEVVREADQIELVDMAPEALRRRLARGDVIRDVDAAEARHFRLENLAALREVALLWLAGRVEEARRRYREEEPRERVVVAIAGGPESAALVRAAADIARMAAGTGGSTARLNSEAPDNAPAGSLLAVHVVRSAGLAGGEQPQRRESLRELVESLGGTYHTVVGDDVPAALLDFAGGVEATRLVVGIGRRSRLARVFDEGVGPAVLRGSGPVAVHLIAQEAGGRPWRGIRLPRLTGGVSRRRQALGAALTVVVLPALTGLLLPLRDRIQLSSPLLVYLLAVVGIALVGGWWPALVAAVSAMLLVNYYFTPPVHTFTIADRTNALALAVFVLVALAVSTVVHVAALRTAQASRARAEAELLSTLAGSVLRGARGLPELLERVREAFGLTSVALLEREEAGWAAAESAGEEVAPAAVEEVVPAADGLRLVLRGRALSGGDRRVIAAFAAQAAVALRQQRLAAQAAAAAELEEANRMRTALLAAVSHDLRTPLASIKAAASSLRSPEVEWGEGDEQELLATVEDSADHLTALVDNLLDMSRIQTSSVRPALRPVGLDEVVPAALVGLDGMAELDVPETLPPVLADPGLLERVVANLIGNALRYGQGSPVRVSAGRLGGRVELRVVDRGPGVPAADRDRIFAPFQRLGDRAAGGVGLGLAVARGFTEAMGGTLTPEDTPGGGLTMVVSLPVAGGDA
ncbi:MAG: DUF4118 domain-containing protein [Mycobacteriales bacterium]